MSYNHRGREARPNRLEVRLSNPELERLNLICAHTDRPASQVVRLALEMYADSVGSHDSQASKEQSAGATGSSEAAELARPAD